MQKALFAAVIALLPALLSAADPAVSTSYTAYRFDGSENWRLEGSGDLGASAIVNGKLVADFTRGAKWIAIAPPDRVFLGDVEQLRWRIRGNATGHPVSVVLHTHFMSFQKTVGEFTGTGEQELAIATPPGPGWTWSGGENDGRLHGPLRLAGLRFEGNGRTGRMEVDLASIVAEGRAPAAHLTVLTADARDAGPHPRFQASIRTLRPDAATGVLRWRFRDWEGIERGHGERQVTTLPPGEPLLVEIEGPGAGPETKFLEAEIALDIPGQEVPVVNPCWLAAAETQRDAKLSPESPFGMGIYLGRYSGPDLERVADTARRAGVKWSREEFSWRRVEPIKGQFRWDYYDNLIATARRNGISVYALLHGWSAWTKPYTEEGIDDYVAYIRRVVARYKNDIHHWEIWNEPNIFFWDGPKELYAVLLAKSYRAIKQEDPTAQVLGMSTSGIDYNFIARTGARGGLFDALTIHPYRKVLEDGIFINELTAASRLAGGKPVWITEMGWSVHTPHNTLRQDFEPNTLRAQAELIARTYLCTMVSGVRPNTSWYDFRDDGEDPIYFEHNMGILYRDFRPKPAYVAFSTLTRIFEGLRLEGAVDAGPGIFAYRFGGVRAVIVLWHPTGDAMAKLPLDLKKARVVNAIGESRTVSGNTVALRKGSPVYVVFD